MVWLLKRIWVYYWYACFAIQYFFVYPFLFFVTNFPAGQRFILYFRKIWLHNLFVLTGLFWKVEKDPKYKEFIENDIDQTGSLFVANHTSYLDIPSMVILRGDVRFMAKVELSRIPFFGRIIRNIDIPVDRTNKRGAYKAYVDATNALKENKNIAVFPEGTTCDDAPKLLPFKNGPFKMAVENNVPIVPVTFLDNWKRYLSDGKGQGGPGITRIIAHAPIYPEGLTEEELKDKVYQVIDKRLKQEYGS